MALSKTVYNLLPEYIEQERLRLEGSQAIKSLAKIARRLGYRDEFHNGQFQGGCIGDFYEFLADNPGCVEAIVGWIQDQDSEEWADGLRSQLRSEDDEDEDEA